MNTRLCLYWTSLHCFQTFNFDSFLTFFFLFSSRFLLNMFTEILSCLFIYPDYTQFNVGQSLNLSDSVSLVKISGKQLHFQTAPFNKVQNQLFYVLTSHFAMSPFHSFLLHPPLLNIHYILNLVWNQKICICFCLNTNKKTEHFVTSGSTLEQNNSDMSMTICCFLPKWGSFVIQRVLWIARLSFVNNISSLSVISLCTIQTFVYNNNSCCDRWDACFVWQQTCDLFWGGLEERWRNDLLM